MRFGKQRFESKYMAIQYFTEKKTMEHQLDVQADGNLTCSLLQMAEPLSSQTGTGKFKAGRTDKRVR